MTLEKSTSLQSIEIIFPSRAINARWDTYITENGEIISGPTIHRKAFTGDDLSEIMDEITSVVSADYVAAIAQIAQLTASLQSATAQLEAQQTALSERDERITALEAKLSGGIA